MFTIKHLLFVFMLALPASLLGQTFYPVTVTSGTQTVTGYNVTVTPDGAPGTIVPSSNCGVGPYFIGVSGVASGYIYNFSNPITDARVQIYGLNDNEIVYFKVNGSIYPVSNASVSPYPGTCGAVYSTAFVSGNLSSSGNPVGSSPEPGVQVTIHPASGFSTFEVYYSTSTGDGCSYNFSFSGNCTYSFTTTTPPSISTCTGKTISLNSTSIPGASYLWTGPNGYSFSGQNAVINNVQTNQSGTYTISAMLSGCAYTASSVVTVNPSPQAPIATSNAPVCSGDSLQLSITNTIPGVTYGWHGPTGFLSTSQSYNLSNTTASDSGYYIASDTSANHCVSTDTILAVVHQAIPAPSIIVYSTVGDTICTGGTIPLNTYIADASSNATYQWKLNGNPIPTATGSSYVATGVNDNDKFSCIVHSYYAPCQVPNETESAPVNIRVQDTLPPPTVTILAYPQTFIPGDTVTFTSYVVNGGINLAFQWMKNGIVVPGAITSSWQTTNVSMGDKVAVVVTSSFACAVPNKGTSNTITVAVPQVAGNTDNLHLYPNPNNGNFTLSGTLSSVTTAMLEITDATGRSMYKEKLPMKNGSINNQEHINMPSGNYMLNVRTDEGASTIPFTIIK